MITNLDRRDLRRAQKLVWRDAPRLATKDDFVPLIAAALKREREEAVRAFLGDSCPCPQCPSEAEKRAKARKAGGGKR